MRQQLGLAPTREDDATDKEYVDGYVTNHVSSLVPNTRTINGYPLSDDITLTQDDVGDGETYVQYAATEQNKLAGIEQGAEVNVNADWDATSGDAQILHKPDLFSGSYTDLTDKPTLFSGDYADLTGTPDLAPVATSGAYSSLTGLPDIPSSYSDLSGTLPAADVTGLSTVATSGSYSDLSDTPTLFSGSYTDLTDKPSLFSGSYTDLTDVPTTAELLPDESGHGGQYLTTDGTEVFWGTVDTGGGGITLPNQDGNAGDFLTTNGNSISWAAVDYSDLTNTPELFSGSYTDLTDKPTLFDGQYSSLTGTPDLAPVATSGAYSDLSGTPSIPSSYSDLSGTLPATDVTGLSTVATSGSYTDLSNTPTLFSGDYADLTGKPSIPDSYSDLSGSVPWSDISGEPTIPSSYSDLSGTLPATDVTGLSTVATSGSYSDLSDTPTLFSGQYSDLTGKPDLFSGSYTDLTDKPTLFSGDYSDLTGTPTIPDSLDDLSGDTDDVPEGAVNLYFTGTRARNAVVSSTITDGVTDYAPSEDTVHDALATKADTSSLAAVATSGDYDDLSGTPMIPSQYSDLSGTVPVGDVTGLANVATTGEYSDLAGTPTIPDTLSDLAGTLPASDVTGLDNVATSGSYNDLSDTPTLFSGQYSDLTGTPSIPSSYSDLSGTLPASDVTGLSNVATSGQYSDLSGTPAIPDNLNDLSGTVDASQIATGAVGYSELASGAVTDQLGYTPENTADKGASHGYAPLNATAHVPAENLPSYVDDVENYSSKSAFPDRGDKGKIYVATDTGKIYRWGGLSYIEIVASPGSTDAVPEGTTNLYFTDERARDAVVSATITNGVTDHAPSEDAVHDALADKADTSDLFSGQYSDLSGTPTIPDQLSDLSGTLPASDVTGLAEVATSGSYNDLSSTPDLSSIGSARILVFDESTGTFPNRPNDDIPTIYVGGNAPEDEPTDADVNYGDVWIPEEPGPGATGGASGVSSVNGMTGDVTLSIPDSYSDLSGSVPASDVSGLDNVATTGQYNDLSGTPSIPSSYSDLSGSVPWSDVSGAPSIPNSYSDLSGNVPWSDVSGAPIEVVDSLPSTGTQGVLYVVKP